MPGTRVPLPRGVHPPFEVYVNGVPQREGDDYRQVDRVLLFEASLVREGKLGFWRWFLGAFGVGTYRTDHVVDVRYETADGRPMVAHALPVEPVDR